MDIYKKLLDGNKEWVKERLAKDADFFKRLSQGQSPQVLWIGCADSRVPANEITNTLPGEIFVHRNIANVVAHTDMNLLSVVDYAVNVLKVKHVIVVGHYGCGGVKAAMGNDDNGFVDNWLREIKDVYRLHARELDSIADEQKRFDRFVELNVIEQTFDLTKTSIIQRAWRERNGPIVHGWVYALDTGLLQELIHFDSSSDLEPIFQIESPVVAGRKTSPVKLEN
jgi:carbonic anhydrase